MPARVRRAGRRRTPPSSRRVEGRRGRTRDWARRRAAVRRRRAPTDPNGGPPAQRRRNRRAPHATRAQPSRAGRRPAARPKSCPSRADRPVEHLRTARPGSFSRQHAHPGCGPADSADVIEPVLHGVTLTGFPPPGRHPRARPAPPSRPAREPPPSADHPRISGRGGWVAPATFVDDAVGRAEAAGPPSPPPDLRSAIAGVKVIAPGGATSRRALPVRHSRHGLVLRFCSVGVT